MRPLCGEAKMNGTLWVRRTRERERPRRQIGQNAVAFRRSGRRIVFRLAHRLRASLARAGRILSG